MLHCVSIFCSNESLPYRRACVRACACVCMTSDLGRCMRVWVLDSVSLLVKVLPHIMTVLYEPHRTTISERARTYRTHMLM